MRQLRCELSSDFVHVTQRGLGRRALFEDDVDKRRYLDTLKRMMGEYDASILAWTLMTNHVHLLMKTTPATLSRFMQRVGISYAQYFNGRHGHVGKVFQNRFSSQPIETSDHLLATIRYIHRNAERAQIASTPDYLWSSYREIAGGNRVLEGEGLCDVAAACDLFGSMDNFIRFHQLINEQDGFARIDGYRPRICDSDARAIAQRYFGAEFSDYIVGLPKKERDKALHLLKDIGLSIRQIERLTGIGRGIITKA